MKPAIIALNEEEYKQTGKNTTSDSATKGNHASLKVGLSLIR